MRATLIRYAESLTPPIIWKRLLRLRGHAPKTGFRQFGAMQSRANPKPLLEGSFAQTYDRYAPLDPSLVADVTRYRLYNVCVLARLCREVPGDFVCTGVSFGVAPRMVYEYSALDQTDKTLHLIDPFEGTGPGRRGAKDEGYNTDPEYVRGQYPIGARIRFHRQYIPAALPLPGVERIAFVFSNTGDPASDAAAIPLFWDVLSPGGAIITDQYAAHLGHYEPVLARLGVEAIWLPSGQGVVFKR